MTSTVCLLAKNEERGIAEWLAFQFVVGFDRIFVYDNGSTDDTASIVQAIARHEPAVKYRFWPDKSGERPQPTAYEHAWKQCETEWIAFFDTDEFFVPCRHTTVNEFLAAMPSDVSGVAVNWLVFGSSGRIDAGEGLVMDRFTRCAGHPGQMTRICKSILRTKSIAQMQVHTARLVTGRYVNSGGQEIEIENNSKTPAVCHDGAQLNHYLLKSREEFLIKKARGHAARSPEERDKFSHIDEDFWTRNDLNDGADHKIMAWRDAVCAKLDSWR